MKNGLAAAAMLITLPGLALADQSLLCQSLARRLAAVPTVIGSTAEVRRHTEGLRRQEDDIRRLRTEMRRSGCGAGSIVSFGRSSGTCAEITRALREAEAERDKIRSQRTASRSILRPSGERNAILDAMRQNECSHVIAAPQALATEPPAAFESERAAGSSSSITRITPDLPKGAAAETAAAVPPSPPVPDRPYDASKKVRIVGPVFLPDDDSLDLANPASGRR